MEKPIGKAGLGGIFSGGKSPQTVGETSFSAKVSRKDVQELEPTDKAELGRLVTTMPKKANKPTKKKEDATKEQQGGGVLRAYDAAPGGSSSSSSTTSGNAEQPEMQFFKEFVNFVKENNCQLPENLKKMLPDQNKECLREQQKKLNKQRNLLNKIQNKQKALDKDKEQWVSWIASVKEEIQKQKSKHEESQKRLTKELEDLQAEEKRLNQSGEEVMEIEPEQDLEDLLVDLTHDQEETGQNSKLVLMQRQMEEMYQQQLEEDRKRMQQHFSEQFLHLAAANMDPYLGAEDGLGGDMMGRVENKEPNSGLPKSPPGLIKNPVAPFGVQRPEKSVHVSSPYGPKEKTVAPSRAGKTVMSTFMEQPDTGQGK